MDGRLGAFQAIANRCNDVEVQIGGSFSVDRLRERLHVIKLKDAAPLETDTVSGLTCGSSLSRGDGASRKSRPESALLSAHAAYAAETASALMAKLSWRSSMETVVLLKRALSAAGKVLRWGQGIQGSARDDFIKELHSICLKCEPAYETVLLRLIPIKNSFQNPDKLGEELRSFAGDASTLYAFKPEHLCSEVDTLLSRLESIPLRLDVSFPASYWEAQSQSPRASKPLGRASMLSCTETSHVG